MHTFVHGMNNAGHCLFSLQIVEDEVVNKYRERLEEAQNKLHQDIVSLSRLLQIHIQSPYTQEQISTTVDQYRKLFPDKLLEKLFPWPRRVPHPGQELLHSELLARALNRRKPFSEKGSGYRDALIWHSILWIAETYGVENDPIAFVTSNTRDFADSNNQLHPDLCADLVTRGFANNSVILFPDMRSFVDQQIIQQFVRLDKLKFELNSNSISGFDFKEALQSQIDEECQNIEVPPGLLPKGFSNPRLVRVTEITRYEVKDARRWNSVTESTTWLSTEVDAVFEISAKLQAPDYFTFQSVIPYQYKLIEVDSFTSIALFPAPVKIDLRVLYYEERNLITLEMEDITFKELANPDL